VGVTALIAAAIWPHIRLSPEFLRTLAGIGASFFLAFVIEATWLATRFDTNKRSEVFLGLITGLAAWGFVGVALLMYLSESHSPGPLQGTESLYFWLSAIALGLLGFSVAFQPVVTHTWIHESKDSRTNGDD
jgi:hypothetical protein